jgi:hypothetical protein
MTLQSLGVEITVRDFYPVKPAPETIEQLEILDPTISPGYVYYKETPIISTEGCVGLFLSLATIAQLLNDITGITAEPTVEATDCDTGYALLDTIKLTLPILNGE